MKLSTEQRHENDKASKRRHYEKNRDVYLARSRAAKEAMQDFVTVLKESAPCEDCGEYYPHYVMDFDHVRGEKVDKISNLVCYNNWGKLMEEIEKCDLVCSNCHRTRTFERLGH